MMILKGLHKSDLCIRARASMKKAQKISQKKFLLQQTKLFLTTARARQHKCVGPERNLDKKCSVTTDTLLI